VGDYGDLKEFAAPRTFDFLRYGTDIGTIAERPEGGHEVDPEQASIIAS